MGIDNDGIVRAATEIEAAIVRFAERAGKAWAEEYVRRVEASEAVGLAEFLGEKARAMARELVAEAARATLRREIRQAAEDAREQMKAAKP